MTIPFYLSTHARMHGMRRTILAVAHRRSSGDGCSGCEGGVSRLMDNGLYMYDTVRQEVGIGVLPL